MPGRLKRQWQEFRRSRPGHRFQDYHRRRHSQGSHALHILGLLLGVVMMLAGVVLMPAPGPGMLVVVLGAVLVARGSRTAALAFDGLELRLHGLLRRLRR